MVSQKLIIKLSNIVYSDETLNKKQIIIKVDDQTFYCNVIDKINTANTFNGGLEAIALEIDNQLIFVIRGADVGIGADIFKWLSANNKFIPTSRGKHKFRASFQDWLWNGLLGTIGLVHFSQYIDFKKFYLKTISDHNYTDTLVVGHSLGGEIAQRLAIDLDVNAMTFSAISPWWSLSHIQRKWLREGKLTDGKIDNYYSRSDPFRYFPFFAKKLGRQHEVELKKYSSSSPLIAMILERIYWAHGLNYYNFNNKGEIKLMSSESSIERAVGNLNKRSNSTIWVDIAIFASGILPSVAMWLASQVVIQRALPQYQVSSLNILLLLVISLTVLVSSALYMLPTLIIHSKWKYVVWGINVFFSWTGIGWVCLLIFAFVLNSISTNE